MMALPQTIITAISQGDMPTVTIYVEDLYRSWMAHPTTAVMTTPTDDVNDDDQQSSSSDSHGKHKKNSSLSNPLDAFDQFGRLNLLHAAITHKQRSIARYLLGLPESLRSELVGEVVTAKSSTAEGIAVDGRDCNGGSDTINNCNRNSFNDTRHNAFRCDPNAKNHFHKAPIHTAGVVCFCEIVADLIAAGADINAVDDVGRTALHWTGSDVGFAKTLLSFDESRWKRETEQREERKKREDEGDEEHRKQGHEHENHTQRGPPSSSYAIINPNIREDPTLGCTPIYWAIMRNRSDLVRVMIEGGADVNAITMDNHRRLLKSEEGMSSSGVGKEPDDDVSDDNHRRSTDKTDEDDEEEEEYMGQTPLFYACARQDPKAAALLLRHGASVTLDDTWEDDNDGSHGNDRASRGTARTTTPGGHTTADRNHTPTHRRPVKVLSHHVDADTLRALLDHGMDAQAAGDMIVHGLRKACGSLDCIVEEVLLAEGWDPSLNPPVDDDDEEEEDAM